MNRRRRLGGRLLLHRGFTLVELIIVVLIMGILTAVALPVYQQWVEDNRIDYAARTMANHLEKASTLARVKSRQQLVVFDTVNDTYTLVGISDPDHPGKDLTYRTMDAPFQTDLALVTGTATFDRFGHSISTFTVELKVDGQTRQIQIQAGGSQAEIQ